MSAEIVPGQMGRAERLGIIKGAGMTDNQKVVDRVVNMALLYVDRHGPRDVVHIAPPTRPWIYGGDIQMEAKFEAAEVRFNMNRSTPAHPVIMDVLIPKSWFEKPTRKVI